MTRDEYYSIVEYIKKECSAFSGGKWFADQEDEVISRLMYLIVTDDSRKVVTDVFVKSKSREILDEVQNHIDYDYDPTVINSALKENYDMTIAGRVYDLLGPDQVTLFCLYFLEKSNHLLYIVDDYTKILFRVCERICTEHRYIRVSESKPLHVDEVTSFIGISRLIGVDSKLAIIPYLIGASNFSKLAICFAGMTVKFPTKEELESINKVSEQMQEDIPKIHMAATTDAATTDLITRVMSSVLTEGLPNFDLRLPHFKEYEIATLIAYLQNVFSRQNPLIKMPEATDDDTDKQKMNMYRFRIKEAHAQGIFLTKMLTVFKSFESNTPKYPDQDGLVGQETENL